MLGWITSNSAFCICHGIIKLINSGVTRALIGGGGGGVYTHICVLPAGFLLK